MKLPPLGRALRHRNYRLFFAGQGTSLVGTWMTRVATGWLVYRLTGSPLLLGVVSFAGQIPTFLLAPIAGVLVDRWDRQRTLVVTQVLAMLQSAALAVLTLSGIITIPQVIALAIFQGLINAFDVPARQSFVVQMVKGRDDLANAIALNSSLVTAARLLGPAVAGVLVAGFGEGVCFVIDAASYLAVIASLLAMRGILPAPERPRRRVGEELLEGLRYALGFPPIRAVLAVLAAVSFAGMPYSVLMPALAARLGGGPGLLGVLMSSAGLGAMIGALWLANRKSVLGLGRVIVGAEIVFGVGLIAFAASRLPALSAAMLVIAGAGMMVGMAACNTVLQTVVDEDKRGRVMSLYSMAFFGMVPFGSLASGAAAHTIGAGGATAAGGVLCIVAGLLFARSLPELRRQVRPIYARLGIIPELAEGVESAAQLQVPPED